MSNSLDPADISRLKREAPQVGVSMEASVRRLIREKRAKPERRPTLKGEELPEGAEEEQ